MNFRYRGVIPASKSLMNRALICSSYTQDLQIEGHSSCDDVIKMQRALQVLAASSNRGTEQAVYDCGAAGTVLRFLSLRLSRLPGVHVLKGTERLMQRPQQDLLDLFKRLEVRYETSQEHLTLHSKGWQNLQEPVVVHRTVSSQFASGLLLNAWELPHDLHLQMSGEPMSEGYLEMTLKLVKQLGMNIQITSEGLLIPAHSRISQKKYQAESDLSSLFAIAAFAALNGEAHFESYPHPSLQPDSEFLEFFQRMGIEHELKSSTLTVSPTTRFKGLNASLKSCPDLFPVLAVLCSFAESPSHLHSASQLIHKESNRIAKTSELLSKAGIRNEPLSDGMIIHPGPKQFSQSSAFSYDTDHDHRLAFAAALLKSQGAPVHIEHPEVVNKSFPEFWQVVGLPPNS
ncbi:MAG: 3-phosphoshikimate 1-carboxyvinyltransferase [Bdellovibrio sp.]